MKQYYVYILTNKYNKVLCTGFTSNLERRIFEHKNKLIAGFTKRYNLDKLVFYETYDDVNDGIVREKQIKGWTRDKKMSLIKDEQLDFCGFIRGMVLNISPSG